MRLTTDEISRMLVMHTKINLFVVSFAVEYFHSTIVAAKADRSMQGLTCNKRLNKQNGMMIQNDLSTNVITMGCDRRLFGGPTRRIGSARGRPT